MRLTGLKAFGQVLNSKILILEGRSILMVEPSQLLQNLRVTGIVGYNAFVGVLRKLMLHYAGVKKARIKDWGASSYVLLLFVDVPDLEPDIRMGERVGRVA